MKQELAAIGKIIAAETIETSHLKVVRSLWQQLGSRWDHHQETAQRITEEKAKAEAAKLADAAKLVEQAEKKKADDAAALANPEPPTAPAPAE